MFQVHVVTAENRHLYEDELDQHHRIRNDIYIGECKWRALKSRNGREIDQFDTDSAIYLLGIDPSRGVVGGTRLLPTIRPHLLGDVFPQLAAVRGVPRAPDIYEWTRIFIIPALREDHRPCRAAGIVKCGMIEYCLQSGIRRISAVAETFWIPRISALGWRPRPLGLPIEWDGMSIVGLTAEMTEAALAQTRRVYDIDEPVLVQHGLAYMHQERETYNAIRAN